MNKVIRKELFFYEYAAFEKDNHFIENVKDTIAALVISKNVFVCCARGTPANSGTNPAADAVATPLTIPDDYW